MGSHLRLRLPLLAAVAALAACTVPAPVLEDHACDGTHPCKTGYGCLAGVCALQEGDAGVSLADGGVEPCTGTGTRPCGSSVGECRPGTQACQGGVWGACQGGTGPGTEVCDGKDNDCNGGTDEAEHLKTSPCELQKGVCAGSNKDCVDGVEEPCDWSSYSIDYEEGDETSCDGKDNDCDGATDEGLDNDGDGFGVDVDCANGSLDCDDWDPEAHQGASELCNGRDDDCNDEVDDGPGMQCALGSVQSACSLPGSDAGLSGALTCNALCSGFECRTPAEVCNGVDDDGDGTPDQGLAGEWARFDLSKGKPASPVIAGVPGLGFTAAWRAPSGEVLVSRRRLAASFKDEAPVTAGLEAGGPVAVTASHVAWLDGTGLKARQLQGGLPAGALVEQDSTGPALLAALDWDLADRSSLAAFTTGSELHVTTLRGTNWDTRSTNLGETPDSMALARVDGSNALVAYSGTQLKARRVGAGDFGNVRTWMTGAAGGPTGFGSLAGAGMAVAFHATEGAKNGIYVARALDKNGLVAGEWATVVSVPEATSSPAIAALSDTEYHLAWIEQPAVGPAFVKTARIRWTGTAWSASSSVTGLVNKDSPMAAVKAVAAGSDAARYMVLFHTFITGGAPDDLVARTNCPAGL